MGLSLTIKIEDYEQNSEKKSDWWNSLFHPFSPPRRDWYYNHDGARCSPESASVCYAYEPNVEGLLDKFKAHNWYLPSFAEGARMMYYIWKCQDGALYTFSDWFNMMAIKDDFTRGTNTTHEGRNDSNCGRLTWNGYSNNVRGLDAPNNSKAWDHPTIPICQF